MPLPQRRGVLWRDVWRRWGPALLPVLLFSVGSFWLLGDLGKWLDDYGFHKRDPETGGFAWSALVHTGWTGFWRPLHLLLASDLQTVFWRHDWASHLVCAALHGVTSLLLWRTLRAMGVSARAAGAAALFFLTVPSAYEVIFWPSTIGTSVGTGVLLVVWLLMARFARGGGWWIVIAMTVLAFMIPCWYEQPATALAGLPLVFLAAVPRGLPLRRRVVRALVPTAACGVMCVVYLALMGATVSGRGGAQSFTPVSRLGNKARMVVDQASDCLLMRRFLPGAVTEGWNRIWSAPVMAAGLVVLLGVGGWAWAGWWARAKDGAVPPASDQPPVHDGAAGVPARSALLVLLGAMVFALAWLPAVAIETQWVVPRLCYVSLVGVAVAGAGMLDLVGAAVGRRRRARAVYWSVVAACVLAGAPSGAVALVGVQSAMQKRYRMDQNELSQLKELIPAPAARTMFMPLRLENWPVHTGSARFDSFARGVWELSWSANTAPKFLYRRKDVFGLSNNRWTELPISDVTEGGFLYSAGWLGAEFPLEQRNKHRVPWDGVVPFVVGADGRIQLVRTLALARPDNRDLRLTFPQVEEAAARGAPTIPEFGADVPGGVAGLDPIAGWRWESSGRPVAWRRIDSWGRAFTGADMHPPIPQGRKGAVMVTTLPPDETARPAYFRAALNEVSTLRGPGDGVEFRWAVIDQAGARTEVGSVFLGSAVPDRKWAAVEARIPAHKGPVALRIEALPGPAGNPNYDACIVTQGFLGPASP